MNIEKAVEILEDLKSQLTQQQEQTKLLAQQFKLSKKKLILLDGAVQGANAVVVELQAQQETEAKAKEFVEEVKSNNGKNTANNTRNRKRSA